MTQIEERIMTFPLKARGVEVRGGHNNYFVTSISSGMNDQKEYAHLFASAPDMLIALRALSSAVARAQRDGFLKMSYDSRELDEALVAANAAIATATNNWTSLS